MQATTRAREGDQHRPESNRPESTADATTPETTVVEGAQVAYAEYGDPLGDPVVVFHGTPGSRLLGKLYDEAAQVAGVRVLSFDRPGYGQSDPRDGFGATDTPDVVAGVLDAAGVDSAGLVAFSGGAPHALATAAGLPERVRGVDVVAGGVPASMRDGTPTPQRVLGALAAATPRALAGLYRGQAWAARRLPPSFVVAQYTAGDRDEDVPEAVADLVKRDFVAAMAERRDGAVRESAQFTGDWGVPLSAVDCRVRWWHGTDDDNVSLADAERVADALPDCEFRRVDADHLGALVATRTDVLGPYADTE
jgi:pimeloyl-ACP methyl ester carboxylesterase